VPVFNEVQQLVVGWGMRLREVTEQPENLAATRQLAEFKFSDNPRMDEHVPVLGSTQQLKWPRESSTQRVV
jgi:hypothetical protein